MTLAPKYDYIIVGAGSAGCVLADRLSEDGTSTVLLIEAGGRDRSPYIHIPAAIVKAIGNPTLDWMHPTKAEGASPGLPANAGGTRWHSRFSRGTEWDFNHTTRKGEYSGARC